MNIIVRETLLKPSPESRIREREQWKTWNPDKLLDGIREINMPYPDGIKGEWYEARQQRLQQEAEQRAEEKQQKRVEGVIYSLLILGMCALYAIGCHFFGAYIG